MSYTKDRSVYHQAQLWGKDELNANPSYRNLTAFRRQIKLPRTRTGTGLPKYQEVIDKGGNATTVMSGVFASLEGPKRAEMKLVFDRPNLSIFEAEQSCSGSIARYLTNEPFYSGAWTSNAGSVASARALSAVREAAVSMSGPTFIGELRETVRMVRRPAAALWDGIGEYIKEVSRVNRQNKAKYFRKNPKRYAKNLTKIASGLLLEKNFGWDPFMSDIASARDTFNDLLELDRVKKFSAGGTDSKLVSNIRGTATLPPAGSFLQYTVDQFDWESEVVRYRGAVRSRAATTARDRLARFGFTWSEFLPTAWELLPWSFLLDYFANIGDIITCSVTDTSDVIWVSKAIVKRVKRLASYQPNIAAITSTLGTKNIHTLVGDPCYVIWRKSTVSRGPTPGIDFPRFSYKLAQSDKHLFNIAALLAQVGLDIHPQKLSKRNFRL